MVDSKTLFRITNVFAVIIDMTEIYKNNLRTIEAQIVQKNLRKMRLAQNLLVLIKKSVYTCSYRDLGGGGGAGSTSP